MKAITILNQKEYIEKEFEKVIKSEVKIKEIEKMLEDINHDEDLRLYLYLGNNTYNYIGEEIEKIMNNICTISYPHFYFHYSNEDKKRNLDYLLSESDRIKQKELEYIKENWEIVKTKKREYIKENHFSFSHSSSGLYGYEVESFLNAVYALAGVEKNICITEEELLSLEAGEPTKIEDLSVKIYKNNRVDIEFLNPAHMEAIKNIIEG